MHAAAGHAHILKACARTLHVTFHHMHRLSLVSWCALDQDTPQAASADACERRMFSPHSHTTSVSLMDVQEVPQPELQPLSMEAKTATAVLKYLQLQAPLLPPVTEMLQEAAQVDLWATRGASLAYTQVGWLLLAMVKSCKFNRTDM